MAEAKGIASHSSVSAIATKRESTRKNRPCQEFLDNFFSPPYDEWRLFRNFFGPELKAAEKLR
jgi:hypothetical protein